MHYSFRDWGFRLFNLESLTVLAYSFGESTIFALLI